MQKTYRLPQKCGIIEWNGFTSIYSLLMLVLMLEMYDADILQLAKFLYIEGSKTQ